MAELLLRHRTRSFSLRKKVNRLPLRVEISTSKAGSGRKGMLLVIAVNVQPGRRASRVGDDDRRKDRFWMDYIHTTNAGDIEIRCRPRAIFWRGNHQ